MTRLLKQFILTAMLALFASQASALFVQPDTYDPRMQGVGTNRYAYAGSDPINNSDRNGHACGAIYLNFASSYCQRANMYQDWDAQISQSHGSHIFGAISMTVQLYGSTKAGLGAGSLFDGMTTKQGVIMEDISESIFEHNVEMLSGIQDGTINKTGAELSAFVLASEQTHLQNILDAINEADSQFYNDLVNTMNLQLNDTSGILPNLLPDDRQYMNIVESVRRQFGRDIDFSSYDDRIAIGNALLKYVENGGSTDLYWYNNDER